MVSEKLEILVDKVKTKLSDIEPEDVNAGSIPVIGQYVKDAIDGFSPAEKLKLLTELNEISSQGQFTELSQKIGVSVEYLKDIKTFTNDACAIQKADQEEIKGLLLRLIKSQTKFEIGQQKAEIIYNVAGDIIIYNSISREPINIPSIQSVLRKDEIKEGEFFRKKPVKWVDYEQGFIVERKEVDEIISRLEKGIQLVLGAPASGKSIILKNVGYKLANNGKKVYIIELKNHTQDKIKLLFENIPKIEDDSIFIVDDAHLYLSYCERLAKDFRGKGNLIIGSRESREIKEEHPKEGALYESLNELSKTCIHIQAEDVTERMIETFLRKQYKFSDDKIDIVIKELYFLKYTKDLWQLSWALKAFNPENYLNIDESEIYKNITYSVVKIKVGEEEKPIYINAEDVFLPLSIFYRFEIPIERNFLEEQLNIDNTTIEQLIGLQEIVETQESGHKMLSLHHSSIAELYLSAYLKESDFGRRIKKNILKGKDEKDLEFCTFYRYFMTADPRNAVYIVISLRRDFSDEKGGFTLLRKLLEKDEIQKSIETGINKEDDLERIGDCVSYIVSVNNEVALRLLDSVSSRIEKETDIGKIEVFLEIIARANKDIALKLVKNVSLRIEKENDIIKIGRFLSEIQWANRDVARKLVDSINFDTLSEIIKNEGETEKVIKFISIIAIANQDIASKLVDSVSWRIRQRARQEINRGKL